MILDPGDAFLGKTSNLGISRLPISCRVEYDESFATRLHRLVYRVQSLLTRVSALISRETASLAALPACHPVRDKVLSRDPS